MRTRTWKYKVLAFAAVLAFTAAPVGCGKKIPPVPPGVPTTLAEAEPKVFASGAKAAFIINDLLILTRQVTQNYTLLASGNAIPASVDAPFRAALRSTTDALLKANDEIDKAATLTWPDLKKKVDPILAQVWALVEASNKVADAISNKGSWWQLIRDIGAKVLAFVTPKAVAVEGGAL